MKKNFFVVTFIEPIIEPIRAVKNFDSSLWKLTVPLIT